MRFLSSNYARTAARVHRAIAALLAVTAVLLASGLGVAQTPAADGASARHPDLSGFWEVSAGDWTIPKTAKLTPAALAYEKKEAEQRTQGKVLAYSSRWCINNGMPFIMGQSPPINIVQGAGLIGIYAEQTSMSRYIYMDGRAHPERALFTPTTDGHSVGHWEGEELVVDTVDFSSRGHVEIPGGGYRTPTSHLVERFRLTDAGKTLTISSRWEDSVVFQEPHTYSITYHRMPADSYAFEDYCDASDAKPFESSGGVSDDPDSSGAD